MMGSGVRISLAAPSQIARGGEEGPIREIEEDGVQPNRRRIRFPRLLGESVACGFEIGTFERLRRQCDHDGERELRASSGGRGAQSWTPLLCRCRLFLRPRLQLSPLAEAPRAMACPRKRAPPAANGVVCRLIPHRSPAPGGG